MLSFFFSCIAFNTVAQEEIEVPVLPIDEKSNLITYEGVIEAEGISQLELFQKCKDWFHVFYKNPTNVIQTADTASWMIFGKAKINTSWIDKKDFKYPGPKIRYKIYVYMKDGRYKYQLTNFRHEGTTLDPIEEWLDTTGDNQEKFFGYLSQVDAYATELIQSLDQAMQKLEEVEEDW